MLNNDVLKDEEVWAMYGLNYLNLNKREVMKTDIEEVPKDSEITIESRGNEITITLPYRKSNKNDIFCNTINVLIAFITLILGTSAMFTINFSEKISNSEWFWLILFLLGGVAILWQLYITFRKTIKEKIVLKPKELFFDSGISPFYCAEKQDTLMRYSFTTRYQKSFSLQELDSLVLTKTKDDSLYLLTFEKSKESIFLAYRMRNDERKWLYQTILKYYGLENSYRVVEMDESRPKKRIFFIGGFFLIIYLVVFIQKWLTIL